MDTLTPDRRAELARFLIQFVHPEKALTGLPGGTAGLTDAVMGGLFGVNAASYRAIRDACRDNARQAAAELLSDAAFAARVERLPLARGATVVGLGDSITDDDQSWLEILRHILSTRRRADDIAVVNAGVSGDTTARLIDRFVEVAQWRPGWIICLVGTNDARRMGPRPNKCLVGAEETARNLAALRQYARTQTSARWVWMTPPPAVEDLIVADWRLMASRITLHNDDLDVVASAMLRQPDPVVDLRPVFGRPPHPAMMLSDGMHPSLAGQEAIVTALIERWETL